MKRRAFMGLGATSIGIGALYGTGAFSSVNAGRGVAVNAAEDSEGALLGIDTTDSGDKEFTNNSSSTMTIDLSSDDDIEFDKEESLTIEDLSAGGSEVVEISGTDDEAIVTIFVELENNGDLVGSINLEREFNIPDASALKDVEGSIQSKGSSGKFEFKLENTQPVDGRSIEIDGIRINRAESTDEDVDAEQVGGEQNDDVFVLDENDERLVSESLEDNKIDVGENETITDIYRDGEEGTVELEPNGEDTDGDNEREFSFERFRGTDTKNNNNTKLTAVGVSEVDITLRGGDGSEAEVELREE